MRHKQVLNNIFYYFRSRSVRRKNIYFHSHKLILNIIFAPPLELAFKLIIWFSKSEGRCSLNIFWESQVNYIAHKLKWIIIHFLSEFEDEFSHIFASNLYCRTRVQFFLYSSFAARNHCKFNSKKIADYIRISCWFNLISFDYRYNKLMRRIILYNFF